MNLAPLRDEATFGLNRIYLLFKEMGFSTTYYVAVNKYVIEQCSADLEKLSMPRFISWDARDLISFDSNTVFIRDSHNKSRIFSRKPAHRVWEGATVTYVALQLAYYMGFEQVVLIGVDHSYSFDGPPNSLAISTGDDPNHFNPSYFGKGFRWQLPDLAISEEAYRLAKHTFERGGREIVNATVGGKLDIFRRVDYDHLISGT